jgi:hypothetical protein
MQLKKYINILILVNLFNFINGFKHYEYYNQKNCNKNINKKLCPFMNNNKNYKEKNVRIIYPKRKTSSNKYNYFRVDWESVISGCHASFNFEKRLANFYIRAAAHDSLSISEGYGGPDGSLVITDDELRRPENKYDSFAFTVSKNALSLANRFDTSVADIIAVCGAYAVQYLNGPDMIISNKLDTILVGRLDSDIPNPANQLVPANANTTEFNNFAIKYGFSLEEFTALLGSHTIIDEKECLNNDQTSYCNPLINDCKNIAMFTWNNMYFKDLCNKNISMEFNTIPREIKKSKKDLIKGELCKFTSNQFKEDTKIDIQKETEINVNEVLNETPEQELLDPFIEQNIFEVPVEVSLFENNEYKQWFYTINDAWLGQACQNKLESNYYNDQIKESMNKFQLDSNYWNKLYIQAYKKMINNNVRWINLRKNGKPITGKECYSGYKKYNNKKICKTAFLPEETFYE